MRLAIAAFIAGGSLLLFLPQVPQYWRYICIFASLLSLLAIFLLQKFNLAKKIALVAIFIVMGFAWNAQYAENRFENILSIEL